MAQYPGVVKNSSTVRIPPSAIAWNRAAASGMVSARTTLSTRSRPAYTSSAISAHLHPEPRRSRTSIGHPGGAQPSSSRPTARAPGQGVNPVAAVRGKVKQRYRLP